MCICMEIFNINLKAQRLCNSQVTKYHLHIGKKKEVLAIHICYMFGSILTSSHSFSGILSLKTVGMCNAV